MLKRALVDEFRACLDVDGATPVQQIETTLCSCLQTKRLISCVMITHGVVTSAVRRVVRSSCARKFCGRT